MKTILKKWGNSQGFRIPREACNALGVDIGSIADVELDENNATITIRFEKPGRKYKRNRKVSIEELASGWDGGKTGEEWGGEDVGAEVVR